MSTGAISPFQPVATVAVASGTVTANTRLAGSGDAVLVTNPTASLAYVSFGSDSTAQATTADMPVLPNGRVLLNAGPLVLYCAALLTSGSGSVLFTRGTGSIV